MQSSRQGILFNRKKKEARPLLWNAAPPDISANGNTAPKA